MAANRMDRGADVGAQSGAPAQRPWPELPANVVAELEQIEFRLSGSDQRAARIEELMRRTGGLRSEIAQWVRNVRGVDVSA